MVFGRDITRIVKKKSFVTSKDKKDWVTYTEQMYGVAAKESYTQKKNFNISKIRKLDLHGTSLAEANNLVKKFISESFSNGYRKLLIVTGKGLRSKSYNSPYISEKLSVLKYSVPEFIKNDEYLSSKISRITKADRQDGGEGAIYIFLKKNNKFIK